MPGSGATTAAEAAAALMDHPAYVAELLMENAGVLQSNFCVMLPESIYTFLLHVGASGCTCQGLLQRADSSTADVFFAERPSDVFIMPVFLHRLPLNVGKGFFPLEVPMPRVPVTSF